MKKIKLLSILTGVTLVILGTAGALGGRESAPRLAAIVMSQVRVSPTPVSSPTPLPSPSPTPVPSPSPTPTTSPTPTPTPVVDLIAPQSNDMLTGIAEVTATVNPHTSGSMTFQYSTNGSTWMPIAAEAFLSDDGEWSVRWDTTAIHSGPVYVQAMFQTADGLVVFSQPVMAFVDQAPVAVVNASAQSNGAIMFDGTQSSDPDGGNVVQWIWDFGDGSGGSGPTVSHTYASLGTSYSGSLTVVDNNGNSSAAYFAVNFLLAPAVDKETKCVCKSIDLRGQTPPQNALGPKGDGSKPWPPIKNKIDGKTLGPLSKNPDNTKNYVGYAFEIAVEVDGDPSKCGEIQVAKRTVVATGLTKKDCTFPGDTWDGVKNICTRVKVWTGKNKDLNLDGTDDIDVSTEAKCTAAGGTWDAGKSRCTLQFPQSGTKFGPDEGVQGEAGGAYESPFSYKVHVGKQILWWDHPNVGGGGNGTAGNWDFISLIRGTDGKYCYVAFSVAATRKATPDETIKQTGTGVGKDSVPGVP